MSPNNNDDDDVIMTSDDEDDEFMVKSATKEEFDEDGNVTQVGNLHFIQGILGQGAFGTVRLARRKLNKKHEEDKKSLRHTLSTPLGGGKGGGFDPFLGSPASVHVPLRGRRPRRREISKSKSAPGNSDFFKGEIPGEGDSTPAVDAGDYVSAQQQQPQTPENAIFRQQHPPPERRHKSPSVVSKLGLFIQSRVSFEHDDDDDEEELVAVKIFNKSILKRRRTMERDKKSKRVRIKTALEQVEREIALMKKLSHPNLVNLYEVIDSPESDMLYMVLEYMPLGEILTYQNDGTFRRKDPRPGCTKYLVPGIVNGHFNEEQAALYFVDILHGLAYLHQVSRIQIETH